MITEDHVERRAQEIARIEGRPEGGIREEDRERARRELLGQTTPDAFVEQSAQGAASLDPAEPPAESGGQTPPRKPSDEQTLVDREVEEGVREAEHERMLGANAPDEDERKKGGR